MSADSFIKDVSKKFLGVKDCNESSDAMLQCLEDAQKSIKEEKERQKREMATQKKGNPKGAKSLILAPLDVQNKKKVTEEALKLIHYWKSHPKLSQSEEQTKLMVERCTIIDKALKEFIEHSQSTDYHVEVDVTFLYSEDDTKINIVTTFHAFKEGFKLFIKKNANKQYVKQLYAVQP